MSAPRERVHAWKHESQGPGSLTQFCETIVLPARPSDQNRRKYVRVVNKLAEFLGRAPLVDDLSSATVQATLARLINLGRSRETVKETREILSNVARRAVEHRLLSKIPNVSWNDLPEFAPVSPREPLTPWTAGELDQLFASARMMPEDVDGIPSRRWWPAFILVLLDAEATFRQVLDLAVSAYDARRGDLAIGLFRVQLHALTIEAINAIFPHGHDRLLPFSFHQSILFRRFKHLLFRANLSHVEDNMFERLRITARDSPGILNRLNPSLQFMPRDGKPYLPRARDRRRWTSLDGRAEQGAEHQTTEVSKAKKSDAKELKKSDAKELNLVRVQFPDTVNLLSFVNQKYIPQRLADASPEASKDYRRTVERFSNFLASEATFDNLEEDCVEEFLAWMKASGLYRNATINLYRIRLLAVWRHAWRKRKVTELPRDITRLKVSKLLPEAWSVEQVQAILDAAARLTSEILGVPANLFWTALILTLYCTGLRIDALMSARREDLDIASRWLKIPADNQKQDASQVFRLPVQNVQAIVLMDEHESGYLFPWPFDPKGYRALTRHYREILKAAGLPTTKRDLFHKLRRTSGTAVCQVMGKEAAQEHLGHSDSKVTERYLDPTKIVIDQTPSERIPIPKLTVRSSEPLRATSGEIAG